MTPGCGAAQNPRVSLPHDAGAPRGGSRATWFSLAAVLLIAIATTIARVEVTLRDPNFDARDASGLLKSDPGLLYYLTERVVESGGAVPDDFHADPRIEHPDAFDVPAHLPVAQEFVVAWCRLALGDALPLHVFCLWIAGAFASSVIVGVWLLARELSGSAWLALLAAALASALPASWRTTGFVLMDEDFSLPFLALHLGLAARALRVRTNLSVVLAAVALGAALATWHATNFFFALEAVCVLAVCLWSGRVPATPRAWLAFVSVLVAFAVIVPFLREGRFLISTPMGIVYALTLTSAFGAARSVEGDVVANTIRSARRTRVALTTSLGVVLVGAWAFGRLAGGGDAYAHVFALLTAKLEHLGSLPADPLALSPDVRLMWQGPFATLDGAAAWTFLGTAWFVAPIALLALATFVRARSPSSAGAISAGAGAVSSRAGAASSGNTRARDAGIPHGPRVDPDLVAIVCLLACVSIVAAWAIQRVVVLPAILLPAVAALACGVATREAFPAWLTASRARVGVGILTVAQVVSGIGWLTSYRNPWYGEPRQRGPEIAALVRAIPTLVPEDAAIASDSMNSTAILVHTRRRAILSPKWESAASRARVVEFLAAFAGSTPAEFAQTIRTRFACRYVLIDRFTLGYLSSYAAGLRGGGPEPGTAAATFLSTDAATLENVPGWRLIYRSPPSIRQSNGAPTDFFRLYELVP